MPDPTVMQMALSRPRAAPNAASPRIAARASFSIAHGSPSRPPRCSATSNPTRDGWFDRPGSGRPEGERSAPIPTPTPTGLTPVSADRACVVSTARSIRSLRVA